MWFVLKLVSFSGSPQLDCCCCYVYCCSLLCWFVFFYSSNVCFTFHLRLISLMGLVIDANVSLVPQSVES